MDVSKCLSAEEKQDWNDHKLYDFTQDPRGYGVFADRPLPAALKSYALGDVKYTDKLARKLMENITDWGLELVFIWTDFEIARTWEEQLIRETPLSRVSMDFWHCWTETVSKSQRGKLTEPPEDQWARDGCRPEYQGQDFNTPY